MAVIFSRFALAFTQVNISLKALRSAPRLADSATTNSRATCQPLACARSRFTRSCASMEYPSLCSRDETRAHTTTFMISVSPRSEEHTSELQSRLHLVCRLLLEKKNN